MSTVKSYILRLNIKVKLLGYFLKQKFKCMR
jgi:hypothetical protein